MSIFHKVKSELEKPRSERPLGSGWLSGSGALLAALTSLLLVVVLAFPAWFVTPELLFLYEDGWLRLALRVIVILGYLLALISLLLSRDKVLGYSALFLTVISSLIVGTNGAVGEENTTSLYFGLDFFVINVLFVGFLFIPIEKLFPAKKDQTVFRPEWEEDMFYYLVSSMLVQILSFLTLAPASLINTHLDMSGIQEYVGLIPFVLQLFIIMVVTDFAQYWLHRLFHQVPFLWRFHSVHHSAKSMDWLAGARMHFLEIAVLRGVTATPMFVLGFDPVAIQTYILIVYFYSSFVHANVGWNLKRVESVMVTPRFHHWHHGKEKEAIDVNFAIHFPLYDKLFGTYHMPEDRWPKAYGIGGDPVPNGYWKQFLYPFTRRKKKTDLAQ